MAESKTQPTAADVTTFLESATPAQRREDGLALAEIFREVTGTEPVLWGPSMVGFGSYRYVSPSDPKRQGEWPKVAFSPRKAQLSLYGLKDLPEGAALLPQLGGYTEGAGCVYVKKLDDIDLGVLRRLISIAWTREDDPLPDRDPFTGRDRSQPAEEEPERIVMIPGSASTPVMKGAE